jgi:flavin reductase (DIM6/NTAB) family NADH-FMN oxidoreductase RutF
MKKINSDLFKLTMSKYATGVTIISINKNNTYIGKTVNSFASLSLSPPLVLFSLDKKSSSLNYFKKSNFIGINILAKDQKKLSNHFSMKEPDWDNAPYYLSNKKVPLIKNCVANIHCNKIKLINQGDHVIFICKVDSIKINQKKRPLLYVNSKYI